MFQPLGLPGMGGGNPLYGSPGFNPAMGPNMMPGPNMMGGPGCPGCGGPGGPGAMGGMDQRMQMMQQLQMMMQMLEMMTMMMGGGGFMGDMMGMPGMCNGMPGGMPGGGGFPGGGMPGGFPGGGMPGGGFPGGGFPGGGFPGGGFPGGGFPGGGFPGGGFPGGGGGIPSGGAAGPIMGGAPGQGNQAAVDYARRFTGRDSYTLKGQMNHFTAAGGKTNNCADFVSSSLESTGGLKGHFVGVRALEQALKKQGYRQVPANMAKPGDVWMNHSRGHTELVTEAGGKKLIGSNNIRQGFQRISEKPNNPGSGVYYSRG